MAVENGWEGFHYITATIYSAADKHALDDEAKELLGSCIQKRVDELRDRPKFEVLGEIEFSVRESPLRMGTEAQGSLYVYYE